MKYILIIILGLFMVHCGDSDKKPGQKRGKRQNDSNRGTQVEMTEEGSAESSENSVPNLQLAVEVSNFQIKYGAFNWKIIPVHAFRNAAVVEDDIEVIMQIVNPKNSEMLCTLITGIQGVDERLIVTPLSESLIYDNRGIVGASIGMFLQNNRLTNTFTRGERADEEVVQSRSNLKTSKNLPDEQNKSFDQIKAECGY